MAAKRGASDNPSFVNHAGNVSATLALNEYLERDLDARMERTRRRPLPEGRVLPAESLAIGAALLAAGLAVLACTAGALAVLVTASIAGTYLLVYTPLKPITSLCSSGDRRRSLSCVHPGL
ncbi:MAG TPA: UbiA family prenyltransferase [Gemmatimonadales bacterium]